MSYVDAILDKDKDAILVVERHNGKRVFVEHPASYVLYYDDPKGKFRSIYGAPVSRIAVRTSKEFRKEKALHKHLRTYEADFKPVVRCLEDHYLGAEAPKLHTAFFDIETDFDPQKGFAPTTEPFNPITAISIYLDWLDRLVTFSLPPKTISQETAEEIAAKFDDTFIFTDEVEMLNAFLDLVDDADVLSGWNSEGYDIPYVVNRITKIMSKNDTRRLCLWGQLPKPRTFERYGAESQTYDLLGRVHMDYMQLYRKYTYHELHSYSLDNVSEIELGEKKVAYEGTLDQLYNRDYEKFIEYNRQDTALLAKLDKKLQFLDLANTLAHDNTVLLQTTMGAVAVTEQAIINEAHRLGFVIPNRREIVEAAQVELSEEEARWADDVPDINPDQAAGAYVAYPKVGMHDYIGAIDINSLYPSTIRALNMCNETIVGQIRPDRTDPYIEAKMSEGLSFAAAWEGLFGSLEYTAVMELSKEVYTVDWEGAAPTQHTGEEIWNMVFNSNMPWMISANGTIFSYEKPGIIPGLLERWYAERKEMQKKKKESTDPVDVAYWDLRQQVKKINLNSLYGALLNPGCRFFDKRIGQSTTLTGRVIAQHMDAFVNECITGVYDYIGDAVIYGDTDSVYFSAWPAIKDAVESGAIEWNKDICIQMYDSIADQVNDSFPAFMEKACHCPRKYGALIKGGRELVASKGLFIKKKRYAVLIYDLEGKRMDVDDKPGKVKAMGLDLKRSDTPKLVQDFLYDILVDTLTGATKEAVIEKTTDFKREFAALPPWEKGTPKRVNNLTNYGKKEEKLGKANMPGHVRAAINWNNLRKLYNDQHSPQIVDGMKTIVCKLRPNPMGYTSVGYPIDVLHVPEWFKDLPFDHDLMETTIVDQKVENLLGVLKWDVALNSQTNTTFGALFTFE